MYAFAECIHLCAFSLYCESNRVIRHKASRGTCAHKHTHCTIIQRHDKIIINKCCETKRLFHFSSKWEAMRVPQLKIPPVENVAKVQRFPPL